MVNVIATAARRRQVDAHNERVWLAWNTAALTRVARMPPLKSLLVGPAGPSKARTWQQQLAIARQMTA